MHELSDEVTAHNWIRHTLTTHNGNPVFEAVVFHSEYISVIYYTKDNQGNIIEHIHMKEYDIEVLSESEVLGRGRNGDPDMNFTYEILPSSSIEICMDNGCSQYGRFDLGDL